jgi:hypothetical protein
MKTLAPIACFLIMACCVMAEDAPKPKIKVAKDGFPTGQETPEGVACDLARAFIDHDPTLFTNICLPAYGPKDYDQFLQKTVESIKAEAAKKEPSPEGPKSLGKVFAARHLSRNGPASYGYASFGFADVMFVDVGVFNHNGGHKLIRTLVIKRENGKWYADPLPTAGSGLLGDGLNEESNSQKDFSEAYEIQK